VANWRVTAQANPKVAKRLIEDTAGAGSGITAGAGLRIGEGVIRELQE
jgi:hypothetical protein